MVSLTGLSVAVNVSVKIHLPQAQIASKPVLGNTPQRLKPVRDRSYITATADCAAAQPFAVIHRPTSAHWGMISTAFAVLLLLCGWLGLRLGTVNKENADLRLRIESLKRQMRLH